MQTVCILILSYTGKQWSSFYSHMRLLGMHKLEIESVFSGCIFVNKIDLLFNPKIIFPPSLNVWLMEIFFFFQDKMYFGLEFDTDWGPRWAAKVTSMVCSLTQSVHWNNDGVWNFSFPTHRAEGWEVQCVLHLCSCPALHAQGVWGGGRSVIKIHLLKKKKR